MKVKILTRHFPINYGSLLQSIATQSIVERLGHEGQIVDYIPESEYGLKGMLGLLKNKREWSNSIIKKILYIILRYPGEYIANCRFSKMRKKYLNLTQQYSSYEELKSRLPKSDIYLTGSDQVWGEVVGREYDKAYFWDFINNEGRKVAYSASFGKSEFSDKTLQEFKKYLQDYKGITVRENIAVNLLDKLGISNFGQVMDPVFLQDSKWWSNYIDRGDYIKDKFILVYQIHANEKLEQYSKKIALEKGLKLVRISPFIHQIFRGGKPVYLPNISEFLWLFKNAEQVVTDSFHGTSFAIIFNTQFVNVLSEQKTSGRLYSLLQTLDIEDRMILDIANTSIVSKNIDYNTVNAKLEKLKDESIQKLRLLLQE